MSAEIAEKSTGQGDKVKYKDVWRITRGALLERSQVTNMTRKGTGCDEYRRGKYKDMRRCDKKWKEVQKLVQDRKEFKCLWRFGGGGGGERSDNKRSINAYIKNSLDKHWKKRDVLNNYRTPTDLSPK